MHLNDYISKLVTVAKQVHQTESAMGRQVSPQVWQERVSGQVFARLYKEVESLGLDNNKVREKLVENCRQTAREFGKEFAARQTSTNPVPTMDKEFISQLAEQFKHQALASIGASHSPARTQKPHTGTHTAAVQTSRQRGSEHVR